MSPKPCPRCGRTAIVTGMGAGFLRDQYFQPFGIRWLSVIYYTRLIAYRVLPFIVSTPFGKEDVAAEAWQLEVRNDPKLLQHPQLGTCIIVLAVASLIFTALAAYVCSRREFYVKTAEKASV